MTVDLSSPPASILDVTAEIIRFRDAGGTVHELTLVDAARADIPEVVGYRGLDAAPWWVRIGEVGFEFDSADAAYDQLLDPLGDHGWDTLDTT